MIAEELDFLFSLRKHGIKLGLSKMDAFLRVLGQPQERLKIIHVAGTNGKGSCTSFISSILIEQGYRVGTYTSPHFVRFNERMRIGTAKIPDAVVCDFLQQHRKYIIREELTFFEVTTALAFSFFVNENVDFAVIETGLGGRYDATNVCTPLVSAITTISLEHTEYLGDTIAKIAFEKGGIIKPNVPVCVGLVPEDAETVFRQISAENDSTLFLLHEYYTNDKHMLQLPQFLMTDLASPLQGEYQFENAALACLTTACLALEIQEETYVRGLRNVIRNTGLSGRYEVFHEKPYIIFDSAHNPDGIARLAQELLRSRKNFDKTTILFTALRDKNIQEMISEFLPVADELYFTTINFHRALTFSEIACLINENPEWNCSSVENPGAFITSYLQQAGKNDRLVVTGSMYLLGEIKSFLTHTENKIFI
jgi:dihydrofolate synthase/folylpolyglutamate synthase